VVRNIRAFEIAVDDANSSGPKRRHRRTLFLRHGRRQHKARDRVSAVLGHKPGHKAPADEAGATCHEKRPGHSRTHVCHSWPATGREVPGAEMVVQHRSGFHGSKWRVSGVVYEAALMPKV